MTDIWIKFDDEVFNTNSQILLILQRHIMLLKVLNITFFNIRFVSISGHEKHVFKEYQAFHYTGDFKNNFVMFLFILQLHMDKLHL